MLPSKAVENDVTTGRVHLNKPIKCQIIADFFMVPINTKLPYVIV